MMRRRTALTAALAAPFINAYATQGKVRLGLSLPLTGVQASVAAELLAGYDLAWADAASLGVEVQAEVEDDRSKPDLTAAAVRKFARDASIVAATGLVGTPHAQAAVPVARQGGLPLVGIRSGAGELRDGGVLLYHLRASYEAELDKMLRTLSAVHRRVLVLASRDSFGTSSAAYVRSRASTYGVEVGAVVMSDRDGAEVDAGMKQVLAADHEATALLVLMITKPALHAVQVARAASFLGAVFVMSFAAGRDLSQFAARRGVGVVTAFPLPRASHDTISDRFRAAAMRTGKADLLESITASEGFTYGLVIAGALAGLKASASRTTLVEALDRHPAVRLGEEVVSFDNKLVGRQYLRTLHFDALGVLRG